MTLVAAIDQGSTATKGAVLDVTGRPVARAEVGVQTRRRGEEVEHDPEELLASVRQVLGELRRWHEPAALALACQRSTCLVWERASGRPLTAAVSWQDRRTAAAVAALADHGGAVEARTGLRLSPHYAGSKLGLLLRDLPRGVARAAAGELLAGTLDAFLVHRLTGAAATEPGHAGRTLLYDLDGDVWDDGLCRLFGVPLAALPALRPSLGDWGDAQGLPLVAVAGDQQAALVGHGGGEPGVVAVHFGTGAFVLAGVGMRPRRHPGLLAAVVWSEPGARRFQLEGSVNSAGSAVQWAAELAGRDLAALRVDALEPERLALFLPAFHGVAAPWWRPAATAVLWGPPVSAPPEALVESVLAGVAMRVVDCLEALTAAGCGAATVRVSGRLTRLAGLPALIADASGATVEILAEEEAGLAGVGRLAVRRLHGAEAPVAAPTVAWRREPRWAEERRRRVRRRWREFVGRALDPA
ncbi:MAG TPA: FGGY family carbohydrate kinase [Thermoanaerobaculia bacterium]|nr:FGGY family carbohydrate kinase [Thermoanaerobaculia bacterium]